MNLALILVAAIAASGSDVAAQNKQESVGRKLQKCCVTLKKNNNDRGSGTIITRPVDGVAVNFILTAAHVVRELRSVKTVIDKDGDEKKQVTYRDSEILQEWIDSISGERVGETKMFAQVVNVDTNIDLALLRVKMTEWSNKSIVFWPSDEIPGPGRPVFHCGSPGGQEIGAASVTGGNVARIGCRIEDFGDQPFDQVDCAAMGGSSGGMICDATTGELIGVLTLGLRSGDSFHWMVPIRVIRKWATDTGVEWLLNPKGSSTGEAVKKIPLENVSPGFSARKKSMPTPAAPEPLDRLDQRFMIRDLSPR